MKILLLLGALHISLGFISAQVAELPLTNMDISHINASSFCGGQNIEFKITTRIVADPSWFCPATNLNLRNLAYQVNIGSYSTISISGLLDNGTFSTVSATVGTVTAVVSDVADADNDILGTNSGANLGIVDICGDFESNACDCDSNTPNGPCPGTPCADPSYAVVDLVINVQLTLPLNVPAGIQSITGTETFDMYMGNTFNSAGNGEFPASYQSPLSVTTAPSPVTPNIVATASITCPSFTINLSNFTPASTNTVGGVFEWHSANNTQANTLIGGNAVGQGTYYLFERATSGCYSTSDAIVVSYTCPCVPTCTPTGLSY